MPKANTAEELEFFKTLAARDIPRLRELVFGKPDLLGSYDYRNFGATALTSACFHGPMELVRTLLELGADPNVRSDWDMGPWSPLHCATYLRNRPIVELLLAYGATLDVHTAAGLGRCEDVSRMLDAEPARVREPGGDGCQPLHFADTVEVARLLVDRGAEVDGRCLDHYSTPAQYLCTSRPEVARYLFSIGASPDVFSVILAGDVARLAQLLEASPELIQARINKAFFPPSAEFDVHNILTFTVGSEATPLHAAARANRADAIGLLVRHGLSPNVRGGYDHATPLHVAAWNNSRQAAEALLDNGADIEARSGKLHNNTPAGWAIVAGADSVWELLIERGAQCHPWFLDDARDACAGRFDQVSRSDAEQRRRILVSLSR